MKNFKTMILVASVATLLMAGCATSGSEKMTVTDYKTQGQELMAVEFAPTKISSIDEARQPINALFINALPLYTEYTDKVLAAPEYAQVMSSLDLENKSDEDAKAAYDALTDEQRGVVNEFNAANDDLMKRIFKISIDLLAQQALFNELDTGSLLKEVKFSEMMDVKDQLSLTKDQLGFVSETAGKINKNYQVIESLKVAQ
ncbi:hypothetical protein [Pelagibaculum spongiae]|uniref:Lipoprotein n=1 Tax=Pelagibaculum spongiae TaxID=2080658 RepID=A0A2V1GZ44_9GAMM|nr:hypothetical protein [Pelagibaculum spongiae]PVZ70657.1 hypothetical protein DC094_08765 [Pelagibaculum spongiae]